MRTERDGDSKGLRAAPGARKGVRTAALKTLRVLTSSLWTTAPRVAARGKRGHSGTSAWREFRREFSRVSRHPHHDAKSLSHQRQARPWDAAEALGPQGRPVGSAPRASAHAAPLRTLNTRGSARAGPGGSLFFSWFLSLPVSITQFLPHLPVCRLYQTPLFPSNR